MAADFRAARPEMAARELVIVVHLYPVGDAALTSPSRSLESVSGVRREKAALSSGCKSHPATAPAASNRSSYGGNEVAEAFG